MQSRSSMSRRVDLTARCTFVGAFNFAPRRLQSWGLQVHLARLGALRAPRAHVGIGLICKQEVFHMFIAFQGFNVSFPTFPFPNPVTGPKLPISQLEITHFTHFLKFPALRALK